MVTEQIAPGQRVTYMHAVSPLMSRYVFEVCPGRRGGPAVMTQIDEAGSRDYVRLKAVSARARRPFYISAFVSHLISA